MSDESDSFPSDFSSDVDIPSSDDDGPEVIDLASSSVGDESSDEEAPPPPSKRLRQPFKVPQKPKSKPQPRDASPKVPLINSPAIPLRRATQDP